MFKKKERAIEIFLYKIKKWQYVFYKHFILHGVNISILFSSSPVPLPLDPSWRIFWIALNASYVMEFFLQTLVKRHYMSQSFMLVLQRLLMISSSLAAIDAVFGRVRWSAAALSTILNFLNRRHDVMNTMIVGALVAFYAYFL